MARWDAAWHRRLREVLADLPARPPKEAASVRRRLSEQDVIAFAVIYMGRHLRGKETDGRVTFAECHYEWARMAQSWRDPVTEPMQHRDAFIAPRAVGKALDVDTPVLTHNRGWVRHGDLASGDVVYDEHGRPCNVLAVRNWGERPCYRMTFSDGGEIVADVAHEWVLTDWNRASSFLYKYETRDIARGFCKDRFVLPPMKGIDGAKVDLPLDPYALGVWLGGGHSDGAVIAAGSEDVDELATNLASCGWPTRRHKRKAGAWSLNLVKRDDSRCLRGHEKHGSRHCKTCVGQRQKVTYRTGTLDPIVNDTFRHELQGLGVLGNKHVPDVYMRASREQRLALLQGLLDTDGSISAGGTVEFCQGDGRRGIVEQVAELCRSLGFRCSVRSNRATCNGRDAGHRYRVTFTPRVQVFRLARKAARVNVDGPLGRRSIVSVESTTAETNCISVDSLSQLYLAGENFYATHNSTWWYLIIPLWAAAFGHVQFCAAFAQASSQAVGHLATLRGELDSNPLLRHDFPELCSPARRQTSGTTVADRQGMVHTASGFTFAARGLDSAVLGLKVGDVRPDVLIIDDAEPDESSYSPYLAQKRLTTLTDAIFALNIFARVVMVGTVTMPGSIAHQLVRYGMGDVTEANEWVGDERIRVHHHRAILANGDGTERSIWPQKWPLAWLAQRRDAVSAAARREYAKNYDNDPKAVSGDYWEADDFRYGTLGDLATRWILQVDPAVTTKGSSDWTGLAVVACRPPLVVRRPSSANGLRAVVEQAHRFGLPEWMDPFESQCEVVEARQVKLAGEKLRADIMRTIVRYPKIRAVRIETNAGGETWRTILHDLPPGVKLVEHSSSVSKEARFASALTRWHERRVIHRERIVVLEDQMTGFPRIPHDDVADAVTLAVLFFLHPREEKRQARATVSSYR